MLRLLSSSLLAVALLAGCGSDSGSDPKPTPPAPPAPVDNAVYLRVSADRVQQGMKAYVQQSGTLANALTVTIPGPGQPVATEKSVFAAGQTVIFGVYINNFPVKSTGKITAELVRQGVVLGSVEWDNANPPAWDQPSQSASVKKTLVLP